MPRNGSGSYSAPSNSRNPTVAGTTITAADNNTFVSDLETAVSESIARDGQTTITADLPMSGNKHTGVDDATARTHYLSTGQGQDGAVQWAGTFGGTVDALTFTLTPAISAYTAGLTVRGIAAGTNTGAMTANGNAVGVDAIEKRGGTALIAGDVPGAGAIIELVHDGTNWELTNIQPLISAFGATLIDDADAATAQATIGLAIGTNVQAWDTQLDDIAALAVTDGNFIVGDGANWVAESGATARASMGAAAITTGTPAVKNPLANNSITTQAHGLGAFPTFVVVEAECLSADGNYSAGDRIVMPPHATNGSSQVAYSVEWDATNINIRMASNAQFSIPDHDATYTVVTVTLANWKLTVTPHLVA